jgi:NADH dehydrogenase [ubiquinone] 1 alpha subcomplex assembly factor 1
MHYSRQTVDANGVRRQWLPVACAALVLLMTTPGTQPRADVSPDLVRFDTGDADPGWFVVNDNVMGGRSNGGFQIQSGELLFTGATNTDGGGFSSIRTRPISTDLSAFDGIRLNVKGDGRRYTWRLTTGARWRGREVAYWAEFDTDRDRWVTADIPFSRFVPRFRGNRLDGPPLDPGQITGMGLMIYDGKDGPFEIRVAAVKAFRDRPPFSLEQYRWEKRVIVVSASAPDEPQLLELQNAVTESEKEFDDRELVLITLLNTGDSTADDRVLTAGEVAQTREKLGITGAAFALRLIGKDGTVKLSRDSVGPVDEIYALIDTMPMRRREMSGR